jgi:L-2-hydroxyglutarate oxidase
MTRYVVVGAGIVGLATARALRFAEPGAAITVLEKESGPAEHQSGRNSGVIHSGIYYPPGSAKARLCRAGAESMTAFALEHGIAVRRTGKLIVATRPDELPRLDALAARGRANGIRAHRIGPDEARRHEPFVFCLAALRVESTGVTDYRAVCRALVEEAVAAGTEIRFGIEVTDLEHGAAGTSRVLTPAGAVPAEVVINCAGLYADRLAAHDPATGSDRAALPRIVPFRGEYFELRPERRYLVKGLIYPVPDPALPFLGVHLTRMVDGSVHAGPNAVLALAREGYRRTTISPREAAGVLGYGGFWRLARHNLSAGYAEVRRSASRRRFAADLARLVPAITAQDLLPIPAGVRAQAVSPDGSLVDDFLIRRYGRHVHVLNAPSPAATSAFEIGAHLAGLVTGAATAAWVGR